MTEARQPIAPLLFLGATLLGGILLAGILLAGWDYYRLPQQQRPAHARHAVLRPSGSTGLACGIAGSLLIFLNLTYLVRKRFARGSRFGSLRSWMAFHVLTGVMGAELILIHTALLPRSSLGTLASAGLGIAVVTGLVGRYIYARVPRSIEGFELDGDDIRYRIRDLRARLDRYGIDASLLGPAGGSDALPGQKGLRETLAGLFGGDQEAKRQYQQLRAELRRRPELKRETRHILPLARGYYRNRQWLTRYREMRALMGAWRFLHRWLAIVMLVLVAFHIVLAVRYGDLSWPRAPR